MNIKSCEPIAGTMLFKMDSSKLQLLKKDLMNKESMGSSSNGKQIVLDLTDLAKRTAFGDVKIVESKTLDFTIASFLY